MPTINFIWDEVSDNVLVETDENNQVTTTYVRHREKYGEVFYDKQGNRFSYYHYDGNGSTRKLTGANQAVTKTYIFTGFGDLIASPGLGSTPFAYKGAAGYYTNPVTNDIYVRARTYEPTSGRWLSKDPLGFVDGPNLYGAYFVPGQGDPSGTRSMTMVASNDCRRLTSDDKERCGDRKMTDLDIKLYEFCFLLCVELSPPDPTDVCKVLCKKFPEDSWIRIACEEACKEAKDWVIPDPIPTNPKEWLCNKLCCTQLDTKVPGDSCIEEHLKPKNKQGVLVINEVQMRECKECCDRVYGPGSKPADICHKRCDNILTVWIDRPQLK